MRGPFWYNHGNGCFPDVSRISQACEHSRLTTAQGLSTSPSSRIGSMTGRPWFCLYLKLLAKTAWLRICLNYDWIRLTRCKVCTKQHLLKPIPQQSFHLGCNWSVERIGGVLLHRVCSISGNRTSGFGWVLVWVKIEGLGMFLYFQNRWPTPKLSVSSSSPKLWLRVAFLLRSLWRFADVERNFNFWKGFQTEVFDRDGPLS